MAEFLGVVQLGTFYKDGVALPLPTRPWYSGNYPGSLSERGNGNTPKYTDLQDISKWVIGNTSSDNSKKLKWIKIKDGNKILLIADRVILNTVSWDDLNGAGYINGKKITIDGQEYLCRVLTGGSNRRVSGDGYSGGTPTNNEWDRFITNEDNIAGLPKPTSADLDSTLDYGDLDREHNQLWNWWGNYSWCKEIYSENSDYRVYRGSYSARVFTNYISGYRYADVGWRPVLEVLNTAPLISDKDRNLGNKNAPFDITYQVSDPEGDNVSITEKLNNTTIRTLANAPQNSNLNLVISPERWISLAINTEHTISIIATDSKGASSTRTIKFTKVNAPPQISGQDVFLGDKNTPFSYVYQVSDPDKDPVTVIERLNGTAINTRNNVAQDSDLSINIYKEKLYSLAIDTIHTISIEASDDKGNVSYRNLTFRRVNSAAVITTDTPTDLGSINSPPNILYQVSDPEGDIVNVIEYLDGKVIREIPNAETNKDISVVFNWEQWVSLGIGKHTIKVKATDAHGAYSERVFTFTRYEDTIKMSIKNPIETEVKLNKLVPVINYVAPIGFKFIKIEACNNAFDENPTWEDVTEEAIAMKDYAFANETKTAAKWGFNMRVTIAPGEGI